MRAERPGVRILLTHGTATGRAEGERLLQPGDALAWVPWDTPLAVRRWSISALTCAMASSRYSSVLKCSVSKKL